MVEGKGPIPVITRTDEWYGYHLFLGYLELWCLQNVAKLCSLASDADTGVLVLQLQVKINAVGMAFISLVGHSKPNLYLLIHNTTFHQHTDQINMLHLHNCQDPQSYGELTYLTTK